MIHTTDPDVDGSASSPELKTMVSQATLVRRADDTNPLETRDSALKPAPPILHHQSSHTTLVSDGSNEKAPVGFRDSRSSLAKPITGEATDSLGRRVFIPSLPAPPAKSWAKYFPGDYNPKRQFPLKGKAMGYAIQTIGGIALLFYGYDQGVMSGVVNNTQFKELMGVNSDPQTPRDSAAIGGIVAVYYLGTLVGGMLGGYLGDSIGRVKTTLFGCLFATIGAGLQTSAQGLGWMCVARIISGFGTGHLNAIIPVWSSELAEHDCRGGVLAFEVGVPTTTINCARLV